MKFLLIILFPFQSFCQYYAKWDSKPLEFGISNYVLQDSTMGSSWQSIATVQPTKLSDTNHYKSLAPVQNAYYRVISNFMDGSKMYSHVLFLPANNVSVTNAVYARKFSLDNISWTVKNESNIYFFRIDQSTDGGQTFILLVNYRDRGNKDYVYSNYRPSAPRPIYRITPIFNDLSLGPSIIFK